MKKRFVFALILTMISTVSLADAGSEPSIASSLESAGRYTVQLGSFESQDIADMWNERIRHLGIHSYVQQVDTSHGEMYALRAGPYATVVEAKETIGSLRASGLVSPTQNDDRRAHASKNISSPQEDGLTHKLLGATEQQLLAAEPAFQCMTYRGERFCSAPVSDLKESLIVAPRSIDGCLPDKNTTVTFENGKANRVECDLPAETATKLNSAFSSANGPPKSNVTRVASMKVDYFQWLMGDTYVTLAKYSGKARDGSQLNQNSLTVSLKPLL